MIKWEKKKNRGHHMGNIIAQAIGFLALALFILSYQLKSNRALFLCQAAGSALFCLQFFLLGAAGGCLSLAVNILRGMLLMKYNDWPWVRRKGLAFAFCGVYGVILLLTWAGPVSLLAFTASAVSTLGYWQNNARVIRLSNLLCASPCWLVYDVLVRSWGGVLSEALTIASILVSGFRFGWAALGDPDTFS